MWTVEDDLGLARGWPVTGGWPIAGTPGSGVWLVAHDRVLLFDGSRFARELVVPQRFGIPATVVGRGEQVWVTTESGILLEWGAGSRLCRQPRRKVRPKGPVRGGERFARHPPR